MIFLFIFCTAPDLTLISALLGLWTPKFLFEEKFWFEKFWRYKNILFLLFRIIFLLPEYTILLTLHFQVSFFCFYQQDGYYKNFLETKIWYFYSAGPNKPHETAQYESFFLDDMNEHYWRKIWENTERRK